MLKPTSGQSSRRVNIFLISSLIFALDRITKFLIIKNMFQGQSIKIFPNIFHITLVLNNGIAFGLLKNKRWFFIFISFLVITSIIVFIRKNRTMSPPAALSLGLILGGAIGNLVDRIRLGYIIDFLDFRVWPVFNVADSAITVGVVIFVLNTIFRRSRTRKSLRDNF